MTENNDLSLYQRLANVHKAVSYLKKNQSGRQYSYVGSSDVLGQLHGLIDENGLLLLPSITDHNVTASTDENHGKQRVTYFTELDMTMTWVNIDNPQEKLESHWYAQGVDIAGEKGVGKALTYGEKYFLLKFFNIATDQDDPDAFQNKTEQTKADMPRVVSKTQVTVITKIFEQVAKTHGADTEMVIANSIKQVGLNKPLNQLNTSEYGKLLNYISSVKAKLEKKTQKEQTA
ncbi:hypothetical protein AYR56_05185 [Loigolactobacillus backii]|uniref:Single-stranded DNA-binding protein n=1 Tax=Loigolactobacillus backii TaxID=375175 RepID=A0A192H581_9LACO|nr:ERF family protein [Loigolactobacillus backii]ANK63398.1 hypothetical protein AYR53_11820 [Loigolactobacillus backii]ANK69597.1 hypothetical protein AYR56_05185 [Loigolactobacillus backii]